MNIRVSIARFSIIAGSVLLGAALFVGSAAAQGRGGFGFGSGARIVGGSRSGGRVRGVRPGRGHYFGGNYYPGYYPDYDSDYEVVEPDQLPAQPSTNEVVVRF